MGTTMPFPIFLFVKNIRTQVYTLVDNNFSVISYTLWAL